MATKKQLQAKQEYLETIKWIDSEAKGIDTCGSYDYCDNCDKSKDTPCARAFYASQERKRK